MENYKFRYSTSNDSVAIMKLLHSCFGFVPSNNGALNSLTNRYYLAFDMSDRLVAITGMMSIAQSDFNGYQLDWTCTDYKHQGKGLQTYMITTLLKDLPPNSKVYVSAWRLPENGYPNLHNILTRLNFKVVQNDYIMHLNHHSKYCTGCTRSEHCTFCTECLYLFVTDPSDI